MIPLGTDRARRRPTQTTYALIAICVGVHLLRFVLARATGGDLNEQLWQLVLLPVHEDMATTGRLLNDFRWWQLLTYQFLHASVLHLLGNMLFLWVFGPLVEDRLGRWWFLAFYLAGGVAAGAAHAAFEAVSVAEVVGAPAGEGTLWFIPPAVGASGSIAAVTGAFLVLFPLTRIRMLFFFGIIGVFSIPSWWFIVFAIAKDFFFHSLGGGRVAYAAHLGGYAFGIVVAMALLWLRVIPRETYDLFSIGRQAHRRRSYREAVRGARGGAWRSEAGRAVSKPAGRGRPAPPDPDDADEEARDAIARALAEGDTPGAARAYLELVGRRPGAVLARDAQMKVANQLFESGRHQDAEAAYAAFLRTNAGDRETAHVRLLSALINARYLNDPIKAGSLLAELNDDRLPEDQRALARALREEVG